MNPWLVVIAAGAVSYLLRVSMLVLASRMGIPPVLERAARFAVPTAFAALAASSIADHIVADPELVASAVPVIAVAVGVVAVRRTGSPHAALLAGMPALWALSALTH